MRPNLWQGCAAGKARSWLRQFRADRPLACRPAQLLARGDRSPPPLQRPHRRHRRQQVGGDSTRAAQGRQVDRRGSAQLVLGLSAHPPQRSSSPSPPIRTPTSPPSVSHRDAAGRGGLDCRAVAASSLPGRRGPRRKPGVPGFVRCLRRPPWLVTPLASIPGGGVGSASANVGDRGGRKGPGHEAPTPREESELNCTL